VKIHAKTIDEIVVLEIEAPSLGGGGVADLDASLQKHLQKRARLLVIDLGQVEHVAQEGLRVLLAAAEKLRTLEGRLILCSLHDGVSRAFEAAGFATSFELAADQGVVETLLEEKARRLGDPLREALKRSLEPGQELHIDASEGAHQGDPAVLAGTVAGTAVEILASLPEFQAQGEPGLMDLDQLAIAGGSGDAQVQQLLGAAQRWIRGLVDGS